MWGRRHWRWCQGAWDPHRGSFVTPWVSATPVDHPWWWWWYHLAWSLKTDGMFLRSLSPEPSTSQVQSTHVLLSSVSDDQSEARVRVSLTNQSSGYFIHNAPCFHFTRHQAPSTGIRVKRPSKKVNPKVFYGNYLFLEKALDIRVKLCPEYHNIDHVISWLEFLPLVNTGQDTWQGSPKPLVIIWIHEGTSYVLAILAILSWNTRGTGTRFPAACPSSHSSFRSHMVRSVRGWCSPRIGQELATLASDWLTLTQLTRHMVRATHYITHSSLTKQEHF